MRTVVVHDQMHAETGRHIGVDGAQKLEKLGAAMATVQFTDHFAGGDIERGEQGRRAMAHVVMGAPLRKTWRERQYGLGTIQRLNLTLLIDTQNHRPDRWLQIQAHDVAHLLDKQRISGEFESFLALRLESKGPPNAGDGRLRCRPAPPGRRQEPGRSTLWP